MRVAVVGGGSSCEHEVSLASAAATRKAAWEAGHDVVGLTIGLDGTWCRDAEPVGLPEAVALLQGCDVVFPMVHGPHGEDGTLAALCDLAGVPCVGSGLGAGAVAMDKWSTKLVAEAVGIRTARGVRITAAEAPAYAWTGPVVVKPVTAGSSHGVTLVRREEELAPALDAAYSLDDRVLVEELVVGREVDVAVLGRRDGSRLLSPPLEIVVDGVFDHTRKYDGTAEFLLPAHLTRDQGLGLESAALRLYDALGCAGVARVDFFLTAKGWVLNEVNTTPGFTPASQVPRMYAAIGLPYVDLVDLLIREAIR